jgi:hypothetical protein
MMTITTIRAALQAIVGEGLSVRSLFKLGSAMGPATLYLSGSDTPVGFEPIRRTDSAGRTWLMAFTTPRPHFVVAPAEHQVRYQEITGAALLRLANRTDSCLVLEANSPLECRIPHRATQSLQVAAGYTEALVSRSAAADVLTARQVAAIRRPRLGRERLAS